jgi:outer membrane protein assembly factor BamE (lipoprotein component of BamABCDE complex)
MKKFSLLILLLASACANVGHDFDASKVSQLKPGVSTEQDAIALFGQPYRTSTNAQNNHVLLQWVYAHASALVVDNEGKGLAVSFDERGKMLKVIDQTHL